MSYYCRIIITMKKSTEKDKQFLITVNLSNRDFLTNLANILWTQIYSFTAFIIASYGAIISIAKFNLYSAIVGIIFCGIIIYIWRKYPQKAKKMLRDAEKFNQQYQKYYFELYPDKKNELH